MRNEIMERIMEEGEDFPNHPLRAREVKTVKFDASTQTDVDSAKSCKVVSLTCWMALLSFLGVIMQILFQTIDKLSSNQNFWKSADKLISLFENRTINMTCNPPNPP